MINLKNIQTEVDAGFLYGVLADNEVDKNVANVFRQMSEIEHSHALAFLEKNKWMSHCFHHLQEERAY